MSDPRTWQLLQGVQACLEQIKVADGYMTDAGDHVTLEPAQEPDEGSSVVAVVLEALQRPTNPAMRQIGRAVTVLILAKVSTAADNAQLMLHSILDDVDKAISAKTVKFPPQITYPIFADARAVPVADGLNWVGVEIRYQSNVIPLTR